MTLIAEALAARLAAFSGLAALVGTRIYARKLPQGPTYPAVTYYRVSGMREESLSGASGLAHPRYTVTAWATTYAGAQAVAEQVRLALECYRDTAPTYGVVVQSIVFLGDVDLQWDEELHLYAVAGDYEVWHEETKPA
jgi:hypothetical protein